MADPLSISASIVALLQLTETVISYLKNVHGSSSDRQRIFNEVSVTSGILMWLKEHAERKTESNSWALTVQSLQIPGGPLEQFKLALERLASNVAPVDGWRKATKALSWPFKKEEVEEILKTIERQKTLFQLAMQNDHAALSEAIMKDITCIDNKIDAVGKLVAELQINQKDQKTLEILAWLSPLGFPLIQNDLISRRQEGTGLWLLESNEFQNWLNGDQLTLFCPGIPGAGKSMLASIVIDHLAREFQNENVGIAFAFCSYQNRKEQTPVNLFASLLEQLIQRRSSIPEDIIQLHNYHVSKRTRPVLDEVFNPLLSEISRHTQTFIVVDALDECDEASRSLFISKLRTLQTPNNVNLLVTSRFVSTIKQEFEQGIQLEIRANVADVQRYLEGQMHRLPRCVLKDESLQEEIIHGINEVVDGMFLLAQLHLDSLTDKLTIKAVRRALMELPRGAHALDKAYDEALGRINNQKRGFRELAEKTLAWIIYAQRPLKVDEFRHALAIDLSEPNFDEENLPDMDEIISSCAGLVTVDAENEIVRLVHYTTQEYFERVGVERLPQAQQMIAASCLHYLTFDAFQGRCESNKKLKARLREFKFLDYTARYWGIHLCGELEQTLEALALGFLCDEYKTSSSAQILLASEYFRVFHFVGEGVSGVHLCAYFGLKYVLVKLCTNQLTVDSKDTDGQTPLAWAARYGHEAVVRQLLATGQVNAESKDKYGRTPLSWAASNGYEAMVRLLLATGQVNADLQDKYGRTPLSWAASNGYEAMVWQLLATGQVNVDSQDKYGWTPLSWAARNGYEAMVRLLLATGQVNTDSQDKYGRTPLSWAARYGHEAVVRLLLTTGQVNVDSQDKYGRTPLLRAARNGYEAVVRLLLATDQVNADLKDKYGWTPLSCAASTGHEALVRLLRQEKDSRQSTPLTTRSK